MTQQEVTIKIPEGFIFTEDNLPRIAAMAVKSVGAKPLWVYEDGWHGTLTFSDKLLAEHPGCILLLRAWPSDKQREGRET